MEDSELKLIRVFKDRIRIFLILFVFGEDYKNESEPHLRKVFKTEVRIQKIDFLLRNPDYLSYELMSLAKNRKIPKFEARAIIQRIFKNKEPMMKRMEMEKFFFGAYEDIDDVISFLTSINFIEFRSQRSSTLKKIDKIYFVTATAIEKIDDKLLSLDSLDWYVKRCQLIKKYFGSLSGTQLKANQYQIKEYKEALYGQYIEDIQPMVKAEFAEMFGVELP
ncbi:MAG: hypothetical protein ACFB0D_22190 [Phormidesmis sp.]